MLFLLFQFVYGVFCSSSSFSYAYSISCFHLHIILSETCAFCFYWLSSQFRPFKIQMFFSIKMCFNLKLKQSENFLQMHTTCTTLRQHLPIRIYWKVVDKIGYGQKTQHNNIAWNVHCAIDTFEISHVLCCSAPCILCVCVFFLTDISSSRTVETITWTVFLIDTISVNCIFFLCLFECK